MIIHIIFLLSSFHLCKLLELHEWAASIIKIFSFRSRHSMHCIEFMFSCHEETFLKSWTCTNRIAVLDTKVANYGVFRTSMQAGSDQHSFSSRLEGLHRNLDNTTLRPLVSPPLLVAIVRRTFRITICLSSGLDAPFEVLQNWLEGRL